MSLLRPNDLVIESCLDITSADYGYVAFCKVYRSIALSNNSHEAREETFVSYIDTSI